MFLADTEFLYSKSAMFRDTIKVTTWRLELGILCISEEGEMMTVFNWNF